jgi:hypothetical protein
VPKFNLIRTVTAALALTAVSFAAGIAGDLSEQRDQTSGVRVVLRIPPELPADTVRAAPLRPLRTAAASAETARVTRLSSRINAPLEPRIEVQAKPEREHSLLARKPGDACTPKAPQPAQKPKHA